jgi:hypothetical protein
MSSTKQQPVVPAAGDESFFLRAAIAMSVIIVAGFSLNLALGRSSFASPPRVHVHAILFMGWMVIFLVQSAFAASGRQDLHRKLGWLAAAWLVTMVISGLVVTATMVRNGHVPFFFQPLHFLVFDSLAVLTFAGLAAAAIGLRRQTLWHRRLHFCGMVVLLAPAFGRLLPLPLLQPWGWEVTYLVSFIFLLTAVWLDVRRSGRIHPAWRSGVAVIIGLFIATQALTYSPIGTAIYARVTRESPGATIAPLEFPAPPPGMQITGREQ